MSQPDTTIARPHGYYLNSLKAWRADLYKQLRGEMARYNRMEGSFHPDRPDMGRLCDLTKEIITRLTREIEEGSGVLAMRESGKSVSNTTRRRAPERATIDPPPDVPIMQCPDCNGTGKLMALVDFADRRKSGAYEIECRRCLGIGAVSRKQEEWSRIGGVHRTWRIAQDESQRECAKRLGITATDLSAMEAGRADPSSLVEDTPEVLRNER